MSEIPPPVDTLEHPHEPTVPARSSIGVWVALLGGPVVWFAHFMVVYLVAEAVCTPSMVGAEQPWSDAALIGFVVAATVVAVCLCGAVGLHAWKRVDADERTLRAAGVALAIGSAATVIAVGIPAVLLGPC